MNKSSKQSFTPTDTANRLHRSVLLLLRVLRPTRQEKGLTFLKLGVLGCLYRDGTATATELAAYLRIKPQSLTRLVAQLEEQKLIVRRLDGADRRQNLLEITESGGTLLIEQIGKQRLMLAQIIEKTLTPAEQGFLGIAADLIDQIAGAADVQADIAGKPGTKEK